MVTFGLLYMLTYVIVLVTLQVVLTTFLPTTLLTHLSFPNYLLIVQRYSIVKNFILMNFFLLTGLPPFGLFFIKLNLFGFVLYQIHYIFVIIFFILFLINMIYYAQIFNFKNFKKNSYIVISQHIFSKYHKNTKQFLYKGSITKFKTLFILMMLLIINILAIIFFSDLYIILSL